MFYATDKTALDAAIKFARENGSASRETTKSGNNGLEDYIPYLDSYGCRNGEGNIPDPTLWIVHAYPTTSFGSHGFSLSWWTRKEGAKVLTKEEMALILASDDWFHYLSTNYTRFMVGGLVYHSDSNEWGVHT